ncbi:MAG: sulfate ABC transporter substrate-binding protein [Pegethrix bostrychoides GSE-TBD4-15B]|uniref:Sulfate ABC transporter substrate-binding protein n=1 Tax=Pegethrix bostrychoides GSE-TBD4-15B TaxID=2839662 RepID=A0A951U3E0_9CYAN|nr:sulfate ABC transporter substrate-binding protein [Pegethrix bostrychoides GSE-TBD4-15B]
MRRLGSVGSFFSLFLVGVGLCLTLAACNSSGSNSASSAASPESDSTQPVNLTLVSYAVTQAAYEQIIPKFVTKWQAEHQQQVVFDQSYGGSGSQARAVIDGLEADVVALALALDTQKIEKAGLIDAGWEKELPNDAILHQSVAALVTRAGNPKNVKGWQDLGGDVQVITANPKTSGGARWNFMALWGAVTQKGGSEAEALEYTRAVFKNVPVLPKDAREATDVFFKQGQGDVLINYENEVLLAKQKGENLPYVVPTDVNISIDNPVAVVDQNVEKHGTREVAEAFVQFLFTPAAQEEFAKVGFRPVDQNVAAKYASQFPKITQLFTVQDLGGWSKVQSEFFDDGAVFDKIQASER